MREEDFRSFDIKLTDGRYFKNVLVCSDGGVENNKKDILDNQYTYKDIVKDEDSNIKDNIIIEQVEMDLFHINDDDCDNVLATIKSEDIEYMCNPYKDREVI